MRTTWNRRVRPRLAAAPALAALVALLASTGCGGDAEPTATPAPAPQRKVALIGWDAGTWDVIDPLLRRGELPALARLLERGSRGVLLAEPPMYSPVLWTTLATGFRPADHGVTEFQLPDPQGSGQVLAATFHRRRAPLWRIASRAGRSVGFAGWWTTWPAEPVRGWMISDHLAYNRWDAWARRPAEESYHLTFPPGLAAELEPFAVRPEQLEASTLTELAPFNAAEQREMMEARRPIMFHAPSVLRFGYSTDASNQAFAEHMLDTRGQPDLFGLVFILSDVAGHVFWHAYQPELYDLGGADFERLREAVPNVYRRLDRWTGEILDRLEPDSCVIVLSDHGMAAKRMLPVPNRNPAGDHVPEGIVVFSGCGGPVGADLGVRNALDLAPTVLALLGLPLGADMPGTVIDAALAPDLSRPAAIPTWGDGREGVPEDATSPGREDYEERLRSLGYIQ